MRLVKISQHTKIIIGMFVISILDEISHIVCSEFTLNSTGVARQMHPEIMGDYILQPVRNNGRVVYRSKEIVFKYQMYRYVYLYSFNAEQYVYHRIYRRIATWQNGWMVRLLNISVNCHSKIINA